MTERRLSARGERESGCGTREETWVGRGAAKLGRAAEARRRRAAADDVKRIVV